MRRNQKEITDPAALRAVIQQSMVCRVGLSDGHRPYIVPLCFGYEDGFLYFHAAHEGQKIEIIKKNNCVSALNLISTPEIVENQQACNWTMKYQSVIGFGTAVFLEDAEEKQRALAIIMKQYSERSFSFSEHALAAQPRSGSR